MNMLIINFSFDKAQRSVICLLVHKFDLLRAVACGNIEIIE